MKFPHTPAQKDDCRRRWAQYGLTFEQGMQLRRRAQMDLFFLSKELLGYSKLTEASHRPFCDGFVKKDPEAPDFEAFGKAYRGLHDRLFFYPRGGFKSTLDGCDCVQWTITFPEIRINMMSDRLDLSQDFVGSYKKQFTLGLDGNPRIINGGPSLFQILFFEYCDTSPDTFRGTQTPRWVTPARRLLGRDILEPTIRAAAIDAGKTGTHCDIACIDDVLTPESIGTGRSVGTNLRNIEAKISMARNLRVSYGFTNMVGTPQHPMDYNSMIVESEKKRAEQGKPPIVQVMRQPAIELTPKAKALGKSLKKLEELTEHDVTVWFPEEIPLSQLQNDWELPGGRDTVATQKLLDVSLKRLVHFVREALVRATIPARAIPHGGLLCIPWDLAYSTENDADCTVGLPGLFNHGRIYVIDMIRGHYNEFELPKIIAETIAKHRPDRVAIENSQGAKWLRNGIQDELKKLGIPDGFPIEYPSIGQGMWRRNEVNAQATVRYLGNGQLFFSTAIPELEELYNELEKFPNSNRRDDILAALNLLCLHFVTAEEMTVAAAHQPAEASTDWAGQRSAHETLFGYGRGAPIEILAPEPILPQDPYSLLDPVLGDIPE